MRFRSYEKLQQSGIQVRYEYYREVYLGKMQRQDTPENIRERLQKKYRKASTVIPSVSVMCWF